MKIVKRMAYVLVIVILMILSLTIYTNASKDNGETQKEKIFSEIKFLETKLENLFNTMNNIETKSYSVEIGELSKETTEKSESDGNSSGGSGNGSSSSDKNSGGATYSENAKEEEQDKKKFELKANGVLTNKDDINWDSVKTEIENLYISLPTITMDLYQTNINQQDILAFNTDYDRLTNVAKDEKKEETLAELIKVYEYLPKFLRGSGQDEIDTTLVETKYNVLKAYAKLDGQNWQEIANDVKRAIDSYSKLLTNTEIEARKQYSISKCYVMINELQNAVNLQDSAVFLIKYKNLLEEMNNI